MNPQRLAAGRLPAQPKVLWRYKTGGPISGSATVDGGRVFVGSDDGFVHAMRLGDGRRLWRFKAGGKVEATPRVVGGLVVVGAEDGNLYGLDAATGKPRWKYATEDKILGGANAAPGPDGAPRLVVGSYDSKVHCLDLRGKRLWTYETDNYVNGMPAISGEKVIFGGCDGILHIVSLRDGKRLASLTIDDYIAGSATIAGTFAYLGHYGNAVICADLTVPKIVWTYRDRGFPYFSTPAVTDDRLVIGGRDRQVHCIRRADGKGIWTYRTRGKVDSSPVVCDGKAVVGSEDGRVYILRLSDGKRLWSYTIGRPVVSSPYVLDGRIVIGADDGYVYAFG